MQTITLHSNEKQDDLQPVLDVFTHSSLGKIIQKAKWLLSLDRYLQTILPASFAPYCHVMNVNQATLILGVSNAAIATRIQFMSGNIVESLQKNDSFQVIKQMQCRVRAKHINY